MMSRIFSSFVLLLSFGLLFIGQPAALAENDLGQNYITVKEVDTPLKPFTLEKVKLLSGRIKDELDIQYSYLLNGPAEELRHDAGWTFSSDQLLYS